MLVHSSKLLLLPSDLDRSLVQIFRADCRVELGLAAESRLGVRHGHCLALEVHMRLGVFCFPQDVVTISIC